MLLRRLDLFRIAFACFLIGAVFHEQMPKVAPLYHQIQQGRVLTVMITALVCFLAGQWLRDRWDKGKVSLAADADPNPQRLFVASVLLAFSLLGLAVFLLAMRGIPMLADDPGKASAMKLALNIRTFGLTRVTDVFLPFLSVLCFGMSLRYSQKRHPRILAGVLAGLTLAILFFKAGKANAIWLVLGLLTVYDLVQKRQARLFTARVLLSMLACLAVGISIIYVTEGQEMVFTLKYLAGRVFIYSWEGFNFILLKKLPCDLGWQLERFFSIGGVYESPDVILSREITGGKSIHFAVIPTLFGFLYRNGGLPLVACGFLILGALVRGVVRRIERNCGNVLNATAWFFVYLMLLDIFLVGNVFDEIRGMGISVLVMYLALRFLSVVTFSKSRSVA